ncbi:Hsp33 family molecular chaperone HslO [Marininema halotolerans]|uniref:33 kDa chaperonin n=1 Tax=Marininema halotolerans TaxID=1155944 RepID=A0A1I6TAP2_9BACL|nr:Hsp33 family molecular chaperone HslO [Marininema halotolerans]SFS86289.1 molecular chaperone Hsp33 [Marininema halotolerans]
MSNDYVIRGTAFDGQVRAFAAVTTELVSELQRRHQTWPVASAALGRTATAGAMMAMMMKNPTDRLTIQVTGDGPLGQIVVDADAQGHVRGYVDNPAVDLPLNSVGKLDVAGGVGQGSLNIIQDLGLKDPYRGSVHLVSGELGDDFTYYLTVSEQIPSAVGVGVLVDRDASILQAGGFILQMMPGADDALINELEKRIQGMPSVTQQMQAGARAEEILYRILGDEWSMHHRQEIAFQCQCSQDRIEATLKTLGAQELTNLIEEQGQAEVICHFCNEAYTFSKEELEKLKREVEVE